MTPLLEVNNVCEIKDCDRKVFAKKVCQRHYLRYLRHQSFEKLPSPKGERHVNWKGGVHPYPNCYTLQKNRIIILMNNPKCEICEKPAVEIHHRNGNKSDHVLSNLMAICISCHRKITIRVNPCNSKYRRLYGMLRKEIAEKTGISMPTCLKLHKENKLKDLLKTKYPLTK